VALTCFPDNTVLINFAYIGRLDLLAELLPRRMWCLTVSRECRQSFAVLDFDYLKVRVLFGDPLIPSQGESINLKFLRDEIAAPGDKPSAHMGEAETITLAKSRLVEDPVLVTDDIDATALARREGLRVVGTWLLIQLAARSSRIAFTETDAWAAATILRAAKRGWPKGVGHTRAEFIKWLGT
jgi:predicted nucleic acid-binding protein